jgi:hypothetical protein
MKVTVHAPADPVCVTGDVMAMLSLCRWVTGLVMATEADPELPPKM